MIRIRPLGADMDQTAKAVRKVVEDIDTTAERL